MQVQRVQVNTHDPMQVYELVRRHLRGEVRGSTPAALEIPTSSDVAGLGELRRDRITAARRVGRASVQARASRPPAAHGVDFRDDFRNRYLERYWRRAVGDWFETRVAGVPCLLCNGVDATATPFGFVLTRADAYTNVELEARVERVVVTGQHIACLLARYSEFHPAHPTTGYEFLYDFQLGAYQLTRYEAGNGSALAFGNIGPMLAPQTMGLRVDDTAGISGWVGKVQVFSGVVDPAPLPAGPVGLGTYQAGMTWTGFKCTVL